MKKSKSAGHSPTGNPNRQRGFYWLQLKDGRRGIGTKDNPMGRLSWLVLFENGTLGTASDEEVFDSKKATMPVMEMPCNLCGK